MEKLLKKAGWFSIVVAIIYAALGIIIMVKPEASSFCF